MELELNLNCEYIDTCYLDMDLKEIRIVYHDGNILCNIDIDVADTKLSDINEEYILNDILSKLKDGASEYEFAKYLVEQSIIRNNKVKYVGSYNIGSLIGLYVNTDKDYMLYGDIAEAMYMSVEMLHDYIKEQYSYEDEEDIVYDDIKIIKIITDDKETKVVFKAGNINSTISFKDIESHEEHYIKQLILNEIENIYLNNIDDYYDEENIKEVTVDLYDTVKDIFDFIGLKR